MRSQLLLTLGTVAGLVGCLLAGEVIDDVAAWIKKH